MIIKILLDIMWVWMNFFSCMIICWHSHCYFKYIYNWCLCIHVTCIHFQCIVRWSWLTNEIKGCSVWISFCKACSVNTFDFHLHLCPRRKKKWVSRLILIERKITLVQVRRNNSHFQWKWIGTIKASSDVTYVWMKTIPIKKRWLVIE